MGASGTWRPVVEGRFFADAAEDEEERLVGGVPGRGRAGRALVAEGGIIGVLGWKKRREVMLEGARCSRKQDVDENG